MPNHVKNIVTFHGQEGEIAKLFAAIRDKFDDGTTMHIDFNKIIPMPEELNGETSDNICRMAEIYVKGKKYGFESDPDPDALSPDDRKRFDRLCGLVREYGAASWYNWSVDHWDTKWNAYEQERDGNTLVFCTAWSAPMNVFKQLSLMFPMVKVDVTFADEDTGSNCGHVVFEAGDVIESYWPITGSIEAYELAFEVRPEMAEWFTLVDDHYEYTDA
jgi:hypothetical protein